MTNFLRRIFILFNSGQNPERSVVRPALPRQNDFVGLAFGRITKIIRETEAGKQR